MLVSSGLFVSVLVASKYMINPFPTPVDMALGGIQESFPLCRRVDGDHGAGRGRAVGRVVDQHPRRRDSRAAARDPRHNRVRQARGARPLRVGVRADPERGADGALPALLRLATAARPARYREAAARARPGHARGRRLRRRRGRRVSRRAARAARRAALPARLDLPAGDAGRARLHRYMLLLPGYSPGAARAMLESPVPGRETLPPLWFVGLHEVIAGHLDHATAGATRAGTHSRPRTAVGRPLSAQSAALSFARGDGRAGVRVGREPRPGGVRLERSTTCLRSSRCVRRGGRARRRLLAAGIRPWIVPRSPAQAGFFFTLQVLPAQRGAPSGDGGRPWRRGSRV